MTKLSMQVSINHPLQRIFFYFPNNMFNNSIFTALLRDDQGGDGVGEERWRRRERGECGE